MKCKSIDKIGIELEGGWDKVFTDEVIRHDGSVRQPLISRKTARQCRHYGELPSPPLKPEEAEAWLRKYYPDATNESCGFHIHLSTKRNLDYGRLMERKFFNHFYKEAGEWAKRVGLPREHPFWARWRGESTYCTKTFIPEKQVFVTTKAGQRYTMLNFCYGLHQTMECRLAPGWETADLAWQWTEWLMGLVEEYLKGPHKEQVHTLRLSTDDLSIVGEVKKDLDSLRRGKSILNLP